MMKVYPDIQMDVNGYGYQYYHQEAGACGDMCLGDSECTGYDSIDVSSMFEI